MCDWEVYRNLVPQNSDHRKDKSHALGGEGGRWCSEPRETRHHTWCGARLRECLAVPACLNCAMGKYQDGAHRLPAEARALPVNGRLWCAVRHNRVPPDGSRFLITRNRPPPPPRSLSRMATAQETTALQPLPPPQAVPTPDPQPPTSVCVLVNPTPPGRVSTCICSCSRLSQHVWSPVLDHRVCTVAQIPPTARIPHGGRR